MTRTLLRAAWYTAIYLLVLTSVAPGDLIAGAALGLAVALALRPSRGGPTGRGVPRMRRAAATAGMLASTSGEVVRGTWRTARFCLGAPASPGLVEIPRGDRSDARVALWGILTGEAPDEYPVDRDDERDVLLVHVLDAGDPGSVRARHEHADDRWQRTVVS